MVQDAQTQADHDDAKDRFTAAWNQLNLVLSFFARIDTKLSIVLGLDLGRLVEPQRGQR